MTRPTEADIRAKSARNRQAHAKARVPKEAVGLIQQGSRMITLDLPWPPTVNHYWVRTRKGQALSKRAVAYRDEVLLVWARLRASTQAGKLSVQITAYPPDNRQRDLDNLLKSSLDAMQHAGVYSNDFDIDLLCIRRGAVVAGGKLMVTIYRVKPETL